MTGRRKIAALLADAFQEEEFFFPKVALNKAGYSVEVVSIEKDPVEIYSYFRRTGLLDVDLAVSDADPSEGGAKSPALLAEDDRVKSFVRDALNAITVSTAKALRDTPIKVNSVCPGWVATDLGGPQAPKRLDDGVRIIAEMALLSSDGRTGGFFDESGTVPW